MIAERGIKEDVLKGRFSHKILKEQGKEIKLAQDKIINQRRLVTLRKLNRSFNSSSKSLNINLSTIHRFTDIRTRKSKSGTKKKKSHAIYNRIIFGHLNNIVRELSYGYVESIKEEMKSLEG